MDTNGPTPTPTNTPATDPTDHADRTVEALIVGAGQAGLATAYVLKQRGLDALVVDSAHRIGDHWRHQYDSLRLFTANRFNGLPGQDGHGFDGGSWDFAAKDEVAAMLEVYARRFALDVQLDTTVQHLGYANGMKPDAGPVHPRDPVTFRAQTSRGTVRARSVVLATGPYGQAPSIPNFARDLDPGILQLHSSQYRRPGQLKDGPVLVVGGGHSGCDIALETAGSHPTTLVGRDPGQVPVRWDSPLLHVIMPLVMLQHRHVLRRGTRAGERARARHLHHATEMLRVQRRDLDGAGVVRLEARVTGTDGGLPQLADGTVVEAANVIWATGFRHDYSWLDLPVLDETGWPREFRGVAEDVDGLFFCGLAFQSSMASLNFFGVGRDAEFVADRIADRAARLHPGSRAQFV